MTLRLRAVAVLGLALLTTPLTAETQQTGKVHRIGLLSTWRATGQTLRSCLRELGWVEGQTFVLESGFADGRLDRLGDDRR